MWANEIYIFKSFLSYCLRKVPISNQMRDRKKKLSRKKGWNDYQLENSCPGRKKCTACSSYLAQTWTSLFFVVKLLVSSVQSRTWLKRQFTGILDQISLVFQKSWFPSFSLGPEWSCSPTSQLAFYIQSHCHYGLSDPCPLVFSLGLSSSPCGLKNTTAY